MSAGKPESRYPLPITMNILSQIETENKEILNGISPGGEDRATVETDLSASSALSGDVPFFYTPDWVKALNSPPSLSTTQIFYGADRVSQGDSDLTCVSTGTSRHAVHTSVYRAFRRLGLFRKAENFIECGERIFELECEHCGYKKRVVFHCKLRICPRCAWLKQKVLMDKYLPYVEHLAKHIKDLRAKMRGRIPRIGLRHVTLTIKNVDDLAAGVDKLRNAFVNLRHQLYYKARILGGIYGVESPVGRDGKWNVHLHLLYYGYFIPQAKLSDDWERLTGGSRVTDIRYVYDAFRGLDYVLKYITKGIQSDGDPGVDKLVEFVAALENVRLVQAFGCFLGKIEKPEPFKCPDCGWVGFWKLTLKSDDGVRVVFSQLQQEMWASGIRSP
jgi:hypothetical protein